MICSQAIEGELWVDGSFLTENIEPRDVDFALRVDMSFLERMTPLQIDFLNWLGNDDTQIRDQIKHDYLCDSYVFCELPQTHPGYPGQDMRQYWLTQFGFDRSRNPKGIAVLSIPGGVL